MPCDLADPGHRVRVDAATARHAGRSGHPATPHRLAQALRGRVAAALPGLVLTALLLQGTPALAAVWTAEARWDDAAEQRYSDWVEHHFGSEFFYRDTPYENIATDCADAAYGMRMVFAFENRLPFVIRDPGARDRLLSQATTRFDHLPEGLPRFRAFAEWVMLHTGTGNLADDTYPVRIDREQIRPGILYLSWRSHAMQVVSLLPTGVIRYLESTAPRAIRPMRSILGFPHQVPGDPRAPRAGDGFRRFRWPEHYGLPAHRLPGYGEEQFVQAHAMQRETLAFYEWVQSRLALEPEPVGQLAMRTMFTLCELTYDRASAIDEAQSLLAELRPDGRQCLSRAEYDEHSTPTRDALLARAFEHVERLPERADWHGFSGRYRRFVDLLAGRLADADVAGVRNELLDWCDVGQVAGGPGRPMDLLEVQSLVHAGRLESDPHASLAARWGLDDVAPRRRPVCRPAAR